MKIHTKKLLEIKNVKEGNDQDGERLMISVMILKTNACEMIECRAKFNEQKRKKSQIVRVSLD
jgi:hypothetical protein